MANYVFFLGGHDAEMVEIRNILVKEGIKFYDKNLTWGAPLSAYKDEISSISPSLVPVFIELKIDIAVSFDSIIIDHHDDYAGKDKKTSLEQVADLLGITLNRHQQLISANDKGHIREMRKMCASDAEIAEIRALDRKAQGVTEEDERLAEESIENCIEKVGNNAVIVKSQTNKISPVIDRLYGKYKHIFISTPDGKMVYSGSGNVVNTLKSMYERKKMGNPAITYWSGGDLPDYGYFGTDYPMDKEEIVETLNIPENEKKIISHHIFMFPFRLKKEDKFIDLKNNVEKDGWQYKPFTFQLGDQDAAAKYTEFVYFHEYVRRALFSDGADDISYYFERKTSDKDRMVIYIRGKKPYTLFIQHVSLRLFDTMVGLLTIELLNYDYPDAVDILQINDFGRRIYPQFIAEHKHGGINKTKEAFLADRIEFHIGEEKIEEDFKCEEFLSKDIRIARYIVVLLGSLKDNVIPIIDDRMYTVCWYGNDELSNCLRKKIGNEYEYESSDIWYSLIYIDGKVGGGIANKEMQKELIKAATYARWAEYGTLYGITRYSLICVSDRSDFSYNVIRNHMQRMYYQMVIILLAQRASILKFANDVSKASKRIENIKMLKEVAEDVKILHSSFIHFINRIWFTEVTPQEQGIEMYNMGMKNMGLAEQLSELRHEVEQLFGFIDMQHQREINKKLSIFDKVAFCVLPLILATGFLSMTILSTESIFDSCIKKIVSFVGALLISLIGIGLLFFVVKKKED